MVEEDFGTATLVYEGPDGDTIEKEVENEHVAYFQDHWIVKVEDGSEEHDTIRRIPAQRVYYVERDVEAFEEEVSTVLDDVQSVADGVERELRTVKSRLESAADGVQGGLLGRRRRESEEEPDEVHHIEVETGDAVGEDGGESDEE